MIFDLIDLCGKDFKIWGHYCYLIFIPAASLGTVRMQYTCKVALFGIVLHTVLYIPLSLYYMHRNWGLAWFLCKTHGHTGNRFQSWVSTENNRLQIYLLFYHFESLRTWSKSHGYWREDSPLTPCWIGFYQAKCLWILPRTHGLCIYLRKACHSVSCPFAHPEVHLFFS